MSINGHKTSCTRTMYLRKKRKEKIHNIFTTSLKRKTTLPLTQWPQKLTLPLRVTTFISKTTPLFCHEWQRVECQVNISSVKLASPSSSEASSSSPSSSLQCMSINGHKTSCTRTMYLRKKRKEKIYNILTTSLKNKK